ncbi:MAG: zf-HC2 domain-containing protein [Deltaproteobacteria bacterium]|nr:zf-HC2 domain-containing protein [Deltaproteobacteria bacterium]
MSEDAVTQDCTRLDRWLTAFLDDELDAVHVLEVEEHLGACEPCRERVALDRAVRSSLRATRPAASSSLRQRAAAALLAERAAREQAAREASAAHDDERPSAARADAGAASTRSAPKLVRVRLVAPLAVAAAVALVAGGAAYRTREAETAARVKNLHPATAHMASTFDRFLDELVEAHMQPPPPEVTDDDGLHKLNPFIGVRVSRPELTALGARYLGARMHHRQAAMLQYAVGDRRRVTLYVFDPARVPVDANRLQPRVVDNKHLYLGHVRGYAVAASERDGVGYALASDLSDQETEKAIVMAAR